MKKYEYLGESSLSVIDGKEIYLERGKIYDFNADLKRIKTLCNLGYLKEIETKTPAKKENK